MSNLYPIVATGCGFLFSVIVGYMFFGEHCPGIIYIILWLVGAVGVAELIDRMKGSK